MACCERTCGSGCSCRCHGFTPPAVGAAAAARLSGMWDRARDMYSRAGLRPYRVSVVRARATGQRARGDGPTEVVGEWPILPTPKIGDLTGLSEVLQSDQLREMGTIMLSEISTTYSENLLKLRGESGSPIPPGELAFFEVCHLDAAGRVTSRRRFINASAPSHDAVRAQWSIALVRAPWDRDSAGTLR